MTKQKGIKRLSVILVVAMLLSLIPATLGFAAEVDTAKVEAFVTRLYVAALDRQPDAGGLKYWTEQLATHKQTAAQAISFILIESKEFQAKNLDNSAFLDTVYKAFFNRAADAAGKAFWMKKLEEGYSRRWVIQQMVGAMTGEFQRLCEEAGIVPGKVGGVTSKDLPMTVTAVATNAKTVVATLSKDVDTVVASNFSINLKDDEYALSVIDSVSIKNNVVTIKLVEALEDDETYVLTINNLVAKDGSVTNARSVEFTYKEQKAVSIAIKNTTIQAGKKLEYVIKDAAGNDITDNYNEEDVTLESSNEAVVDPDTFEVALDGSKDPSYAIVNLILTVDEDTQIESGNTIVTVKENLQVLTSIGRWTLKKGETGTFAKPVTSLAKSATGYEIIAEALDQDGKAIEDADLDITYKSLTPTVLVVDVDGTVNKPAAVGSATVLITAKYAGKTVNKTVTVTVKADPVASSMKVSATSVKLVKGSDIDKEIDIEILDQYNEVIDVDGTLTYKMSVNDIYSAESVLPEAIEDGEATITLKPGTAVKSGTLTITATVGSKKFTKTVSVSLVQPGKLAGYVAEVAATKLDKSAEEADEKYGPASTTVRVFAKDANGNYIYELTEGTGAEQFRLEPVDADQDVVNIEGADVTASNVGTAKVVVYVGTAKVQTLTFTVVDSAATLTTVKQVKTVVSVSDGNVEKALFGDVANEIDGAFIGYDQYGDKIQIDDYDVLSSNKAVVDNELEVGEDGTATLTILIKGKIYVITVIVKTTGI